VSGAGDLEEAKDRALTAMGLSASRRSQHALLSGLDGPDEAMLRRWYVEGRIEVEEFERRIGRLLGVAS
jgi:hypothetical protein